MLYRPLLEVAGNKIPVALGSGCLNPELLLEASGYCRLADLQAVMKTCLSIQAGKVILGDDLLDFKFEMFRWKCHRSGCHDRPESCWASC